MVLQSEQTLDVLSFSFSSTAAEVEAIEADLFLLLHGGSTKMSVLFLNFLINLIFEDIHWPDPEAEALIFASSGGGLS